MRGHAPRAEDEHLRLSAEPSAGHARVDNRALLCYSRASAAVFHTMRIALKLAPCRPQPRLDAIRQGLARKALRAARDSRILEARLPPPE